MAVHSFHLLRAGIARKHYLGLKPPKPGAMKFKLANYVNLDEISVPHDFGYLDNTFEWNMLGNDQAGCCVVTGAAHEHMTWTWAARNGMATFEDTNVLDTYKAVTGWDGVPDSASDTGLDMRDFAEYRRTVGIRDSKGNVHRIKAYAEIANNVESIVTAAYVFGAVGIGLRMPQSAESQFDAGVPWTPIQGSGIMGGHYVPLERRNNHGNLVCVTWGRLQAMTPQFLATYCDVAVAYITDDFLKDGRTPRGFDLERLNTDLAQLRA
jgi:hypothetical protein